MILTRSSKSFSIQHVWKKKSILLCVRRFTIVLEHSH